MIAVPILPGSPLFTAVRRAFVSVSALIVSPAQGARSVAPLRSGIAKTPSHASQDNVVDDDDLQYATWEDAEWQ